MNYFFTMLIILLTAAYLTACTPTQLATTMSIQASPLYDQAGECRWFHYGKRCAR